MKNIHILPTDKPSRLFKNIHSELLSIRKYDDKPLNEATQNQHIYITSDEEIKDGEYGICLNLVREGFKSHQAVFKMDAEQRQAMNELGGQKKAEVLKVILTTDQDLIKDGVQAIDDEFLEWFVKNPSCEFVEISNDQYKILNSEWKNFYKIIIPKEEPTFENSIDNTMNIMSIANSMFGKKEEPKQETLEEAAERISKSHSVHETGQDDVYQGVIQGAKWQSERMYSEEGIIDLIQFLSMNKEFNEYSSVSKETARYFLEQFKKK